MPIKRLTSSEPARWRSKAVALAAAAAAVVVGLATAPAFASGTPASSTLLGWPTVHEQQALNQNILIATGNVHTTVVTSPGLAAHNYLVNMVLDIGNVPPGALVLCGFAPAGVGDIGTNNYGHIENDGSGPRDANCAATGTIRLTSANDHILAWATVYSGLGGASVGDFSMNELPVGTVVVTH